MPYDSLFPILFVGLGLHYILTTDESPRSKMSIGGLVVAWLLLRTRMPMAVSLSIQFFMSAYILMVYRLKDCRPASRGGG